jgi:hypothetical protein
VVQVQKVRLYIVDQANQVGGGIGEIVLAFLHPVQAKGSGMVFQAWQSFHPSGLFRQRDIAKAYEGDTHTAANESAD